LTIDPSDLLPQCPEYFTGVSGSIACSRTDRHNQPMQDCSNQIEDTFAGCLVVAADVSSTRSKSCLVFLTQASGNRKFSTMLHWDRPNLTSTEFSRKPVSADEFARMVAFTTNSVLSCIAALELYPTTFIQPGEAHARCAIGAIPIVQISRVAGKITNGLAVTFPFEQLTPAAHEYCSNDRACASGRESTAATTA
jgi:hypothetical protein